MAIVKKRVAKQGYEPFFEMATKRLETIDEEVKARVEAEVAKEKETLNNIINDSSTEIEVPDEQPAEQMSQE